MAENTKIEWADNTWTPVVGCDAVSPACAKCYAALLAARLEAMGMEKYAGLATRVGNIGKWTGKVTLWEPDLGNPLTVKKPASWFLTSMGDIFHALVPFEFLERIFDVIERADQHVFYVLTKREGRAAEFLAHRAPLRNVVVGCTAENQEQADLRRPAMEAIHRLGWRTFVSYEPALDPVDWAGWEFLAWMISGGESGHDARPSHPDWHRGARDFAATNKIPYHFKQWGSCLPGDLSGEDERGRPAYEIDEEHSSVDYDDLGRGTLINAHQYSFIRFNHKNTGRKLDDRTHDEFPRPA